MRPTVSIDMGSPLTKKSLTFKYGRWKSSDINKELTFGNDEKGRAIAAEIANALPMTTTSEMARVTPTRAMMGMRMMEATVCDTKVEMETVKSRMYTRDRSGRVSGRAAIKVRKSYLVNSNITGRWSH